jgi:drug/metabolite transporter (DMT)-like permease
LSNRDGNKSFNSGVNFPSYDVTSRLFLFSIPRAILAANSSGCIIFSSSLAFIFYSMSVRETGIARSNVFTNLIPIFTATTSFILLGEQLTMLKLIGILVVIFGLVLTQRKRNIRGQ